ncbi:mitochondrial import inner membrane translocase subunit Tim29-like [Mercenaria mercenaria]|uniref:mitochondrial import inner membrane translocase subunit Tim29-like n=1 Tax=Mercenaria mercenaria TaxID=6596 RepID=UPI00234FA2BC|nr:mitochondrial import inner membrane translocase subunit Tim29-like [Mercenaria mercenaria]
MSRLNKIMTFRSFWRSKSTIPDKLKGGLLEKIVGYFRNILNDYKDVAVETAKDMRERPIKSGIYVSLITTTVVLCKTNPGEKEYHSRLTESVTDLMLVGERIRNPKSESAVNRLASYANDGRLRCYNIGICSLMCLKSHGPDVKLYSANCKYVKPHWTEFYKTIVDVGVFGKWIKLEEAMKDFDTNPEEWMEDGQPNPKFKYYKDSLVSWDMKLK